LALSDNPYQRSKREDGMHAHRPVDDLGDMQIGDHAG
jgi:hypothetical protein